MKVTHKQEHRHPLRFGEAWGMECKQGKRNIAALAGPPSVAPEGGT